MIKVFQNILKGMFILFLLGAMVHILLISLYLLYV